MNTQLSFFAKQPQHIQDLVLQQYPDRCAREMVEHLDTLGIQAGEEDVRRFRRNNGVKSGWYYVVPPAATKDARTGQYIEALANFNGKVFSNRMLGLKGYAWSICAKRLCQANLITRYDDRLPAKYVRLVNDTMIGSWYAKEVAK